MNAEYLHSDDDLCGAIKQRLTQTQDIDASHVRVGVSKGKVTLEGTVPEGVMQKAVEDLVDMCPGVQDIDNRLRVQS